MGRRGLVLLASVGTGIVLAGATIGALAVVGPAPTPPATHDPVPVVQTGASTPTTTPVPANQPVVAANGSSASTPVVSVPVTPSSTTTTTTPKPTPVNSTGPATGGPCGSNYPAANCGPYSPGPATGGPSSGTTPSTPASGDTGTTQPQPAS
ncbi:MAG TPA: hypothetical protein VE991_06255 [Acidimicrobiales bacterium]|nr:hypothetical protein [Acidimicrobiales bacterium]